MMKRNDVRVGQRPTSGLLLGACLLVAGPACAQGDNLGNHSATQNLSLNDFDIRLRPAADGNHGLGYYGGGKLWNGQNVDGPVLFGYTSGVLGTNQGGTRTSVLTWNSQGRVGIGTSTPSLLLHLLKSDTPAIRMEQTNTGGFTAQTWDIGSNEANFFVRDLTGGSRLPFRIRPGAPTSAVDISASGNVGIGTSSPQARLHVAGSAK